MTHLTPCGRSQWKHRNTEIHVTLPWGYKEHKWILWLDLGLLPRVSCYMCCMWTSQSLKKIWNQEYLWSQALWIRDAQPVYIMLLSFKFIHLILKAERKKSSVCWFSPQMPATVRTGPAQGWDLRTPAAVPHGCSGPKQVNLRLQHPRVHVSRKPESKGIGIWSQVLQDGPRVGQMAC